MNRELKEFIKDTAYRCVWTFVQAFLGCIAVGQVMADVPWEHALSISLVATLACLLKQIGKYAKEHIKGQLDDIMDYVGDVEEDPFEEGDGDD